MTRHRPARLAGIRLAAIAVTAAFAGSVAAQAPTPGFERRTTSGAEPTLPAPEFLPRQAPGFELPPVPPPREPGLASGKSLFVRDIAIEGNTVLPAQALDAIAEPYEGREVTLEELFKRKRSLAGLCLSA